MAGAVARVGWCPGALRPMATGDGLVLRIKPRLGLLTLEQAAAIAALSLRFGNGNLDLTGRANLQIRGVRAETFDPLIAALGVQDLLDDNPEAEAVRNIVMSPLTAIDPDALCDIRPAASALEARLAGDRALWSLPAKWSIAIDQGGRFTLAGVAVDLRFEAAAGGGYHVRLAGDPGRGFCAADAVADVAAALCRQALTPEPVRMAAFVAERGGAAVFAEAGVPLVSPDAARPAATTPADVIGRHHVGGEIVLGVGAPFGALKAEDLAALVACGRTGGAGTLRLTPWRALLLTGLSEREAYRVTEAASERRLIVDPADPRLAVAACSGAPACPRATTPVRHHAEFLAEALAGAPDGIAIHVSGCAKGCAHPATAPWTLVGQDGRYDLLRHAKAGDVPLVRSLTFQDAATWISRLGNPGRP